MAGPFKLRSGNKSPLEFKMMGSSPVKQGKHLPFRNPNVYGTVLPEIVIEEEKKELTEEGSEFKSKKSLEDAPKKLASKPSEFEEEMEEDVSRL